MNKVVRKITIFLYLSLACFPFMKANINSIFIIFCSLFAIYDFIKNKKKIVFSKHLFSLTIIFWAYLFYEILSLSFNLNTILLHLPFLAVPLLFLYRPNYIDNKIKEQSILVFQVSVLIQVFIYLFVFLQDNLIAQIFSINSYNIPYFRTFVFNNTVVDIHSTYFSAILLVSFTISLFHIFNYKSKIKTLLNVINIAITSLFIFVFISKVVIITYIITIFAFLIINFAKKNIIFFLKTIILLIIMGGVLTFAFKNLIIDRFDEIRTEINRPLVGDYHNSTNIRVAIISCSVNLLKKSPILGYGSNLQAQLNECYGSNYNSDFYKISIYNTHNYYFHIILYGGWFFLMLFVYYLFYLLIKVKYPVLILIIILQILFINFTENFFSRHHGIILFIYLISLFLPDKRKQLT
jgi:O-antigen ligase